MTGAIIISLVIAALGFMVWLFVTAPTGYQDAEGFFYGEPDEHADQDNLGI
jgi:hypothetical protein